MLMPYAQEVEISLVEQELFKANGQALKMMLHQEQDAQGDGLAQAVVVLPIGETSVMVSTETKTGFVLQNMEVVGKFQVIKKKVEVEEEVLWPLLFVTDSQRLIMCTMLGEDTLPIKMMAFQMWDAELDIN